ASDPRAAPSSRAAQPVSGPTTSARGMPPPLPGLPEVVSSAAAPTPPALRLAEATPTSRSLIAEQTPATVRPVASAEDEDEHTSTRPATVPLPREAFRD